MLNDRVLFIGGGDGAARSAVEWVAANQAGSLVTAMPRAAGTRPVGRLAHAPFRTPDPAALETAAAVAALVAATRSGAAAPSGAAGPPGPLAPPDPAAPSVLTAAVLAAAMEAPLLVAGAGRVAELVGLSAWSMNVPSRPADVLLARHIDIAARAWPVMGAALAAATPPAAGAALVEAVLAGDQRRVEAACRTRRRAAKTDGPVRFRRIAPRSAGLRPFAVYLDLLPALAAAGEPAGALLRDLGAERAAGFLGMTIALFV
jgi:hypothetical protein